jgi:CO/xanthine dehydrogenase FAD-binding subunit
LKPPPFAYHAPEMLEEIVALLAEYGSDARCIAGGQSLIPLMNLRMARPKVLIDLNRCKELTRIERGDNDVSYGSMVRQRDAERSEATVASCPLVAKALKHAGPIAVRNRATVGGTLAHADRTAELPGVAMALDAMFVVASAAGEREVAATEFYQGDMATAVEPDEMLKAVRFPIAPVNAYTEFFEVGVRREGVAIVGLAALVRLGVDAVVEEARLAVTGLDSLPVRLSHVEELLVGNRLEGDLIAQAAELGSGSVEPLDDPFVSGRYRRRVAGALVKQALEGALGEWRY